MADTGRIPPVGGLLFDEELDTVDPERLSFHLVLEPRSYVAPENLVSAGSSVEENIRTYLRNVHEKLSLTTAEKISEEFFVYLGIDPSNWMDFQKQFGETDLSRKVTDTAYAIASHLYDQGILVPNDEKPLTREAVLFLTPILPVEIEGELYGLNEAPLMRRGGKTATMPANGMLTLQPPDAAGKLLPEYETIVGRELVERLQLDITNSVTGKDEGSYYSIEQATTPFTISVTGGGKVEEQSSITNMALDSFTGLDAHPSVEWKIVAGNETKIKWLTSRNVFNPQFETLQVFEDEDITFEVIVRNRYGHYRTGYVHYLIEDANEAPEASIKSHVPVFEGDAVTIKAKATDKNPHDVLQSTWEQTAGPWVHLINPNQINLRFIAPEVEKEETVSFRFTVDDGRGGVVSQEISLLVKPLIVITPQTENTNSYGLKATAQETGGQPIAVTHPEEMKNPINPILESLTIPEAPPTIYQVAFCIDGSGSMHSVSDSIADETVGNAEAIIDQMLAEVQTNGFIEIALMVYGNTNTHILLPFTRASLNDPASKAQLIAQLRTAAEQASDVIKTKGYYIESLWHTMGTTMEGDQKLAWINERKLSRGSTVVKRLIVLTDFEINNPENVVILRGRSWTREEAVAAAKARHIEFWPIQFGVENPDIPFEEAFATLQDSTTNPILRMNAAESLVTHSKFYTDDQKTKLGTLGQSLFSNTSEPTNIKEMGLLLTAFSLNPTQAQSFLTAILKDKSNSEGFRLAAARALMTMKANVSVIVAILQDPSEKNDFKEKLLSVFLVFPGLTPFPNKEKEADQWALKKAEFVREYERFNSMGLIDASLAALSSPTLSDEAKIKIYYFLRDINWKCHLFEETLSDYPRKFTQAALVVIADKKSNPDLRSKLIWELEYLLPPDQVSLVVETLTKIARDRSDNPLVRGSAINFLGGLSLDQATLTKLGTAFLNFLNDPNENIDVRVDAAGALKEMINKNPQADPKLKISLQRSVEAILKNQSENPQLRSNLFFLGIAEQDLVSTLAMDTSENLEVRLAALDANKNDERLPRMDFTSVYQNILGNPENPQELRIKTLEFLLDTSFSAGTITSNRGTPVGSVASSLEPILLNPGEDKVVRLGIVVALCIPRYGGAGHNETDGLEYLKGLIEKHPDFLAFILKEVSDPKSPERRSLLWYLPKLVGNDRAIPILKKVIQDGEKDLFVSVLLILKESGSPEYPALLHLAIQKSEGDAEPLESIVRVNNRTMLPDISDADLLVILEGAGDAQVIQKVCEELLKRNKTSTLQKICELMEAQPRLDRNRIFIDELKNSDNLVVWSSFYRLLNSGHAGIANEAAIIASLYSTKNSSSVEPLCTYVANINNNKANRVSAIRALKEIKDDRAVSTLTTCARENDADIKRAAIEALGKIGGEKAIAALRLLKKEAKEKREDTYKYDAALREAGVDPNSIFEYFK